MKETFRETKFGSDALTRIAECEQIIQAYQARGLRMTLRQLYYRLVAANVIPNTDRSYKNLSTLVSNARLSGLLDWGAIEDRVRVPSIPGEWSSVKSLVQSAIRAYRLPRWKTQSRRVELWVEKDAISNVLAPIASDYHVTLMVNRGYSSQSAMYESAERIRDGQNETLGEEPPLLYYLGDFDPSGQDMVRDIRERLVMFGVDDIEVRKLALTREQIDAYNPPPNPAKVTDPRAQAYIAEHGASSWEVDALPPDVLTQIIRDAMEEVVDHRAMDKIKNLEEADKAELLKAADRIMKKK